MPTSDITAHNIVRAVANGALYVPPCRQIQRSHGRVHIPRIRPWRLRRNARRSFRKKRRHRGSTHASIRDGASYSLRASRIGRQRVVRCAGGNGVISAIPKLPKFPSADEIIRNGPSEYLPASPFSSMFSKLPANGNSGYNTAAGTGQIDASNADSPSSNSLADTLSGTARRMFPTLFASPEGAQQ
jgi:hypothetical protein